MLRHLQEHEPQQPQQQQQESSSSEVGQHSYSALTSSDETVASSDPDFGQNEESSEVVGVTVAVNPDQMRIDAGRKEDGKERSVHF